METTLDFVKRAQKKLGITSAYGIAKRLGVTQSSAHKWFHQGGSFDETTTLEVAEILGENPAYMMACIRAERAKNQEVRTIWENMAKLAKEAAGAAHSIVFAMLLGLGLSAGNDAQASEKTGSAISCNSELIGCTKDYRK